MKRVAILGAGGHGQVVADILLAASAQGASVEVVGFLDDDPRLADVSMLGLPVLGPIADLPKTRCDSAIVAIGDNRVRRRMCEFVRQLGLELVQAIHPRATVAADAQLGLGVVVCAGAVVGTGSVVGDGALLNTCCSIDHHNVIGAYAHVCPGSHLAGNVTVGMGAMVGMGSVVLPGRIVGEWAVVAAGSVVTKHVPAGSVAAGTPCRVIKKGAADP